MAVSPCFGCDHRTDDCHPKCEDYNAWLDSRKPAKKERQKEIDSTPHIAKSILRKIYKEMRWR